MTTKTRTKNHQRSVPPSPTAMPDSERGGANHPHEGHTYDKGVGYPPAFDINEKRATMAALKELGEGPIPFSIQEIEEASRKMEAHERTSPANHVDDIEQWRPGLHICQIGASEFAVNRAEEGFAPHCDRLTFALTNKEGDILVFELSDVPGPTIHPNQVIAYYDPLVADECITFWLEGESPEHAGVARLVILAAASAVMRANQAEDVAREAYRKDPELCRYAIDEMKRERAESRRLFAEANLGKEGL